jgi:hypothetical protein
MGTQAPINVQVRRQAPVTPPTQSPARSTQYTYQPASQAQDPMALLNRMRASQIPTLGSQRRRRSSDASTASSQSTGPTTQPSQSAIGSLNAVTQAFLNLRQYLGDQQNVRTWGSMQAHQNQRPARRLRTMEIEDDEEELGSVNGSSQSTSMSNSPGQHRSVPRRPSQVDEVRVCVCGVDCRRCIRLPSRISDIRLCAS